MTKDRRIEIAKALDAALTDIQRRYKDDLTCLVFIAGTKDGHTLAMRGAPAPSDPEVSAICARATHTAYVNLVAEAQGVVLGEVIVPPYKDKGPS